MSPDKYDKSTDLENTFKIFDENGDHFITAEELKNVMKRLGQTLSDEEINMMITEADTDGDKRVNFKGILNLKIQINQKKQLLCNKCDKKSHTLIYKTGIIIFFNKNLNFSFNIEFVSLMRKLDL